MWIMPHCCPAHSVATRTQQELLSDVIRETEGVVFKDEEFIAHLQRLAETENDLQSGSDK